MALAMHFHGHEAFAGVSTATLGTCRSGSWRFHRTPWREALGNGSRICRELWNLSKTLTGIYFQTEDFALFCCAL